MSAEGWNIPVVAEDAGHAAGVALALKLRTVVCAANLSTSLTMPTGFPSTS